MRHDTLLKGVLKITKRTACHASKLSQCELIKLFDKCVANNYSPLPVVIQKGKGVRLYDTDGKEYLDFLSGYAAVSLGHCHPKIIKVIGDQVKLLSHTSRAFYTQALAEYGEYVTELFCYDKVLPMNTGNDAVETAIKLARKWGYMCKSICPNQAKVICAENNFWGRSIAAISASTDSKSFSNYGPFVPGFDTVPFSDIECLEYKIRDPTVCAFLIEPIQGEAGVVIPDPCYLKQARELCTRNKVLMIADEVQCGLGRTGSLLCCDIYRVRPDILVIGKALSAGFMPVSAVLADAEVMDVMEPGTHGSTFGGNPLGCKIAMATLKTLQQDKIIENAKEMGEILRACLCDLPKDIVCEVRGMGLLNAMVLNPGVNATDICTEMMRHGLLVKTAKTNIIRLCPPLVITEKDVVKAASIIRHCIENSRGSCGNNAEMSPKPMNQKTRNKFSRYAEIMKKSKCCNKN
ncbi:hypothetical protein RUM43_007394 [Polyplax serrata]|uniref:Ornithine aminotransferase n=1 Tax=Polyplax serrata TaxID=468196 RepID=A0AAN8S8N4_POLSC